MPKPLHVEAFEHFTRDIPNDQLLAFVAFGLFMEAERKWADGQPRWPSESKYKGYHQNYLIPHQTEEFRNGAERVLIELSNNVVASQKSEFLNEALARYKNQAQKGHARFRKWGVAEAVFGAFIWSILLIALTVIAQRNGIDIIDVYKRLAGTH